MLRISDLKGGASEFPPLRNMTGMTKLVLRSCNIQGNIPDFLAEMSQLRFPDLSFNKVEGGITNLEGLTNLEATYLTGNAFVGRIPEWLITRDTRYVIDISYNKFDESSEPSTCRDNLNLFRSFKAENFVENGKCLSMNPCSEDFKPPPPPETSSNQKKRIRIVAAALMSALALILMILFVAWRKRNRKLMEPELRGLDLQTGIFSFRQIKVATSNFDAANKLGEGGFGAVYKGTLADGSIIAVKQLSSKSRQGNREFVNEIGMMSGLHHPNLVRLYGCCVERNQLLLVYEYMENNSLSHALFGPDDCRPKFDWPTRQKICVGIAKGLVYLHEESPLKMIHRDIKGTNVLLDKDLNPKISDFGLAKLHDEEKTHVTTRVAGTIGYMAPEYALWGYLTHKADLYSFGVVVLELVAGKNNMKYNPDENYVCLLDWALVLQRKGKFLELVDPRLGSNYNKKEALRMIKVALLCTNPSPALRPNMSAVVNMLEGRLDVNDSNLDSTVHDDGFNFQGLRDKYDETQVTSSENRSLFCSTDTKHTDRSSSAFPSTSTSK